MIDPTKPIPDNHVRVSAYVGKAMFNFEVAADQVEKTLKAFEQEIPSARLAQARNTNEGYLAARQVAIVAMQASMPGVVCVAVLWMFVHRTSAAQAKASQAMLKNAIATNGAAWLICVA